MSRGEEASGLRGLLRRELIERLDRAGWGAVDDGGDGSFVLVRLVRPMADGFEATAEVGLASKIPDRPPVLVSDVRVGVAYEPLRRLWALLGDRFQHSLLGTSTRWPDDADGEDEPNPDEDDHSRARMVCRVASEREVPGAVETLAELILSRAVRYADRYASLEALFGALADDEDPGWVDIRVPALLAAAGRFDEAAAALDRYEPPEDMHFFSRQERRTAYQLRRWVTSRGDGSLLPKEPPPSRFEDRSPRGSFAEVRADSRAQREAIEEVRNAGRGRDRDEVRGMLEGGARAPWADHKPAVGGDDARSPVGHAGRPRASRPAWSEGAGTVRAGCGEGDPRARVAGHG